jgi:hypothetical protein
MKMGTFQTSLYILYGYFWKGFIKSNDGSKLNYEITLRRCEYTNNLL